MLPNKNNSKADCKIDNKGNSKSRPTTEEEALKEDKEARTRITP